MDQDNKGTLDLNQLEDELKRLNDENQYMRSAFNILRKNVIIRDEKPQLELKPPDILMDDQELIDLTKSVEVVSDKFYSLEMELDNVYRKISQLTTTIVRTERSNDNESPKKNNVEATARQPRKILTQMPDQSPQCLKLEKNLELITSAWMTMKEKESEIQVLKDKINGLEILMSALEEYVTSDKQNSSFVVPSDLQSDQRRVVEYAQIKRISEKFEMMKSELSAKDQEKVNLKTDYKKNLELFWTEYEELKTANAGLEESLKDANDDVKNVEDEKENVKKEFDQLRSDCEELKTTNKTLTENMARANAELSAVEEEKANIKKEHENMCDMMDLEYEEMKAERAALESSLRSEIKEIADKSFGQSIILDALFEYVTAECKSNTFVIPDDLKSDQRFDKEREQGERITLKFKNMASDIEQLKDKVTCQDILLDHLDKYVKSQEQNAKFTIPKSWQSDQRFTEEIKRANQVAKEFGKMARYGLEVKKKNEIMRKEYEKSYKLLWDRYEKQKTDLENAHRKLTAAVEENENMKKEYENKYSTLLAAYQKLKRDKDDILMKWQAYHVEVQKEKENTRNKYEKNYKLLWDENEQQKTYLENAHRQLDGASKKLIQAMADMDNLRKEKEILLTRLSKLIGDRPTYDNANIADLSDSDRPTKLSECLSELFDNEWTDAFEELTEELSLSDDDVIGRLRDILMNSFHKCKEMTWDRYESLSLIASTLEVKEENIASTITTDAQKTVETKTTMLTSALSIDEKTSLKNIWRSSTISLRNESLTMIHALLSTRFCTPETNLPKTYKYLKVCCDVCWKMFMQEKPMYMEINAEKQIGQEKIFDTERFRAYTKAGKYVAYVVWPALFLHEGGPMLAKGIAQGCNKVPNT